MSETIADIVSEMRGYAHGFDGAQRLPMTFSTFRQYIARIQAAADRLASKMHALQRELRNGKKMGEFAFACALDGFASDLAAPKSPALKSPESEVKP